MSAESKVRPVPNPRQKRYYACRAIAEADVTPGFREDHSLGYRSAMARSTSSWGKCSHMACTLLILQYKAVA